MATFNRKWYKKRKDDKGNKNILCPLSVLRRTVKMCV